VKVQRESTFLRYSANADALRELLGFLYVECCTRNKAIEPQPIVSLCRRPVYKERQTMEIKDVVKEKYGRAAAMRGYAYNRVEAAAAVPVPHSTAFLESIRIANHTTVSGSSWTSGRSRRTF
jgi:hypothetical protein